MAKEKIPKNTVQSIIRAVNILELITESDEALTVTEISQNLKLNKSTAYRLLNTLEYKNLVKKDKNKNYSIGKKIIKMGTEALNKIDLRTEFRPYLKELGEITAETVHLGIIDDYKVFYIDKVESSHTIRMYSSIGKGGPLYCTGIGKALLAFSPPEFLNDFFEKVKLKKFTDTTITEKAQLKKEIKKIRAKGFAVDNMEHEDNIRCAAAPILNYKNELLAAISISGPAQRMTMTRINKLSQIVVEYSKKMSGQF